MTSPQDMPEDPGAPEHTDPEATSAERAEAVADEAAKAQRETEAGVQPEGEADLDAELAQLDAELREHAEEEAGAGQAGAQASASAEPSAEQQLAERTEDLQRLSAEYANFRRRTERERGQNVALAKAQVLTKLLPILDDLDLAERHGDLQGPLKAVRDKFQGVLDESKVSAFGEEGDPFDAERHEAVQDLSEGDEKVIGTVLRRGYRMEDRLLRTAMVIIADPAPQEDAAGSSEDKDSAE